MKKIFLIYFVFIISTNAFAFSKNSSSSKLAFSGSAGKTMILYYLDAYSNKPKAIIDNLNRIYDIKWSPDGNAIAFIGQFNHGNKICMPNNLFLPQLYVYHIKNNVLTQITNYITKENDYRYVPLKFSWSPDSKKIIYQYFTLNTKEDEVVIIDLASVKKEDLNLPSVYGSLIDMSSFSPSGNEILMCDIDNIYKYAFENNKWSRITRSIDYMIGDFAWSPDETCIFYNRKGKSYIRNMRINREYLLNKNISGVIWVKDGKIILYSDIIDTLINYKGRQEKVLMPCIYKADVKNDSTMKNKPILIKSNAVKFTVISDSLIAYISHDDKYQVRLLNIYTQEDKPWIDKKYNAQIIDGYYNFNK